MRYRPSTLVSGGTLSYFRPVTDPIRDYLQYVQTVLGVNRVLTPKPLDPERSTLKEMARTRTGHWPEPVDFDLLVIHRGEGLFTGSTGELWEKMRVAMKLGPLRVLELETDREDVDGVLLEALELFPAPVSLILSATPARETGLRVLGLSKVIESFAPSILVQNPDLKRPSWNDLQLVMRELAGR